MISIHSSLPRTLNWSEAIKSPKASRTLSAIRSSESALAALSLGCSSTLVRSGSVVRGRSSPMGIGFNERSGWLNTPVRVSERILYLPSLIEEIEYITTKKANNRVMKSA